MVGHHARGALGAGTPGYWCLTHRPRTRHRAWRGLLSDDLIDALQAWNDRGEEVMGTHGHEHTNDERAEFWARGQELGVRAQQQLGPDYEVIWRTPEAPPLCE